MSKERPDRPISENIQPSAGQTPKKPEPNFGPGIRPFNNGDILVDIEGADIDFYFVVSTDNKETILNSGDGIVKFKTKLVRKLVETGGWKVYTEGFKIQQSLDTSTPPPKEQAPPPKKATKKQRAQEERPNRR